MSKESKKLIYLDDATNVIFTTPGIRGDLLWVMSFRLRTLPTFDERPKGKWILANGKTRINCSRCYHCSWSLSFEDTVRQFNYCPNCGADMRGDDK